MKVALLLSGGVDSSYSAYLLQRLGHEVVGIYLKLHDDERKHEQNIQNIQKVAQNLGIATHIFDARAQFKERVYDYFVQSYKAGLTPNPCALCNPALKFGFGMKQALNLGCEMLATGHYARIKEGKIQEALDCDKDQSYFLFGLQESTIKRLIFPLGERVKSELKSEAFALLPWLGSLGGYKDSQEICFVDRSYIEVLKRHFDVEQQGIVTDSRGREIGEHKGYMQYTIGKRKGFSVRGAHEPHYVLSINPGENRLVVGGKEELKRNVITAIPVRIPSDSSARELYAKVRYRGAKVRASIEMSTEGMLIAKLKEPVYGVANGQALVLYDDDLVVGGGWIVDSTFS